MSGYPRSKKKGKYISHFNITYFYSFSNHQHGGGHETIFGVCGPCDHVWWWCGGHVTMFGAGGHVTAPGERGGHVTMLDVCVWGPQAHDVTMLPGKWPYLTNTYSGKTSKPDPTRQVKP